MMKKFGVLVACVILSGCVTGRARLPKSGNELQAILDSGQDLVLEKGAVYNIEKTLRFKKPGQKIRTKDAVNISDYATLRIAGDKLMEIIDGGALDDIVLENVIVDGNRYELSTVPKEGLVGGGGQPPLVFFGGNGAENQTVRNNVFMSTRTWATLKVHEGANGVLVENNIFLGAGVGPRGNGREEHEVPFNWGDCISCAARNTMIRNNLIIDPTDVGIVLYGAPGSTVKDNVVSSISRESLGGINLVDPLEYYALDKDKTRFDYRGVLIKDNLIDANGARIHIALPMGAPQWAPKNIGKILVGATIQDNTITGGAAAYGYIVNTVDDFTVTGNVSTALYSGIGEGVNSKRPPDEPGPFLYDPATTTNSTLQEEFKPCERNLLHLLRCNHGKTNELGYRIYKYGKYEVKAVITAAYLEMLGRRPRRDELEAETTWLQENTRTADELRRKLLKTEEFKSKFGTVMPEDLHPYRIKMWMNMLDEIRRNYFESNGQMPCAKEMYLRALAKLYR
ncbi:MAG: right-handed parallel beta-helix repeat-containing protein [Candidatus Hydrogenedentes bacterium]|nr:right-handed parallel beta-helix repeat-containing protein [Candidatus Hydrogenedentota bacterium]